MWRTSLLGAGFRGSWGSQCRWAACAPGPAREGVRSIGWVPLHAAAALTSAGLIVLTGPSRAGKTTTLLYLLAEGLSRAFVANDNVYLTSNNDGTGHSSRWRRISRQRASDAVTTGYLTQTHPRAKTRPCFDVISSAFDASADRRPSAYRSSFQPTPDAIPPRLFLHRSRPRSSAKAPAGGLKPPSARRLQRSRDSSIYSYSTADTELTKLDPRSCSQSLQLTQQWAVSSLPPQGGSEEPTFISHAAPPPDALPTSNPLQRS